MPKVSVPPQLRQTFESLVATSHSQIKSGDKKATDAHAAVLTALHRQLAAAATETYGQAASQTHDLAVQIFKGAKTLTKSNAQKLASLVAKNADTQKATMKQDYIAMTSATWQADLASLSNSDLSGFAAKVLNSRAQIPPMSPAGAQLLAKYENAKRYLDDKMAMVPKETPEALKTLLDQNRSLHQNTLELVQHEQKDRAEAATRRGPAKPLTKAKSPASYTAHDQIKRFAIETQRNPFAVCAMKDDSQCHFSQKDPKGLYHQITANQRELLAELDEETRQLMAMDEFSLLSEPICGETANFLTSAFVDSPTAQFRVDEMSRTTVGLDGLKRDLEALDYSKANIIRVTDTNLGHDYVVHIPPQPAPATASDATCFMYQSDMGGGVCPQVAFSDWMGSKGAQPQTLGNFMGYWEKNDSGKPIDDIARDLATLFVTNSDASTLSKDKYGTPTQHSMRFNVYSAPADNFSRNMRELSAKMH